MNKEDRLWLAGVIDSEGCFEYHRTTYKGSGGAIFVYYYPKLWLSNPDIKYIELVRDTVGTGHIYNKRRDHTFSYCLSCPDVVGFCQEIGPLLRREYQKNRARLIAQYTQGDFTRNESLYLAMIETTNRLSKGGMYKESLMAMGHET